MPVLLPLQLAPTDEYVSSAPTLEELSGSSLLGACTVESAVRSVLVSGAPFWPSNNAITGEKPAVGFSIEIRTFVVASGVNMNTWSGAPSVVIEPPHCRASGLLM